jgi:hypothetical protein
MRATLCIQLRSRRVAARSRSASARASATASCWWAENPGLLLVCQDGSELAKAGEAAGLTIAYERFVDRAYEPDGRLASRHIEGTLYHDPSKAVEQALHLTTELCQDGGPDLAVPDRPHTPDPALAARLAAADLEVIV